jgi:hypothetical protein
MNANSQSAPTTPLAILLVLIVLFSTSVAAQTSQPSVNAKLKNKSSHEKRFILNILGDQRAIWTAPFHLHSADAKWLAPLGLSTAALVFTDRRSSGELVEHGDNFERLRISRDVSQMGSLYVTGGLAGVLYLSGRATHSDRLRETGLLGAEALIDSNIVASGLKLATQRQRPPADNSSGEFFDGGSSFPSGHAISSWTLATIVAQEYGHDRPLLQVGAYGLATAVSLSRFTGRKHFLSDVVVGSAMGYGIGRYVYHKHHDPALDAQNEQQNNELVRSKLFPRISPLYYPRARVYGGRVTWNF